MTVGTETDPKPQRTRVWDPFLPFFHWIVFVGFFVAYFTEDELLTLHAWAGYTIGILVVMRILWGFVGTKHARFSDFVCGPIKAGRYLIDLLRFRAKRYLGHSPAGGPMVLLLLGGLIATVWSGLELYAVEENAGPLAGVTGSTPIQAAQADEDEHDTEREKSDRDAGNDFWEEAHETLADSMLFLIILLVAGVLLASLVHRENLVRSMFSGWKRLE